MLVSLYADDVFSEVNDPSWMARLSLPLTSDYHDNMFVPNGPPSPESEVLPRDALDSSSFSTFGKTQWTNCFCQNFSNLIFEVLVPRKSSRVTPLLSSLLSGKTPEKDGPLGGALLSEVSTLFEMLMTQKADAHPGPRPDVLYRLSAAYRRSLGLDGGAGATPAASNAPRNSGNSEKRSGLSGPSGPYQ